MADRATLSAVDFEHRREQAASANRVAQLIRGYWMSVDPADITGTGAVFLRQSVSAIQAGRRTSALMAAAYAEQVYRLQVPSTTRRSPLVRPPIPDVPLVKLQRSLAYTGLGTAAIGLAKTPDPPAQDNPFAELDRETAERLARQVDVREERVRIVMKQAEDAVVKATVKHVVDGARDMVDTIGAANKGVMLGYVRVVQSENPCGFCLMLVSRGPVYDDDSFEDSDPRFDGPGNHKAHDGCMCTLRPVFTRSQDEWAENALEAEQLWKDALKRQKAEPHRDIVAVFRGLAREQGLADAQRW